MSIASKIMSYFSTKETSYEEQSPQKRRHSLRRKSSNGKENHETTLDESLVYENSNVKEEQKIPINKKSNTPLHDSICNESTIESPKQANILKNVDKINNTSEPGDYDENDIQNKNGKQLKHIRIIKINDFIEYSSHVEKNVKKAVYNSGVESIVLKNQFVEKDISKNKIDINNKEGNIVKVSESLENRDLSFENKVKTSRSRISKVLLVRDNIESQNIKGKHESICSLVEDRVCKRFECQNKERINKKDCAIDYTDKVTSDMLTCTVNGEDVSESLVCKNEKEGCNSRDIVKVHRVTDIFNAEEVTNKTIEKEISVMQNEDEVEENKTIQKELAISVMQNEDEVEKDQICKNRKVTSYDGESIDNVNEFVVNKTESVEDCVGEPTSLETQSEKRQSKKHQSEKCQENPTEESKDESSVDSKNTEMFNSQDERMSDCSRENNLAVPRNENIARIPSPSNSISNASSTNLKVTEEMVKEEEKMEAEGESELEEVRRKTLEELRRTGQKQRYDRLQVLLNRSNLYATYLLERMQEREKAEQKRQQKLEEKIKKKEDESVVNDGVNKRSNRGKKKRKLEESDAKESEKKRVKTTDKEKEDVKPVEKEISIAELHLNRTINGENVDPRQPLLISGGVMRSYQLDGMEWLRGLFEHGINGILADEMGLGKTIQSISLITSLIEHHVVGPFIIIAPLSTLPNWVSEFKKFAPEVFTVLYHGNIEQRTNLRRKLMRVHKYEHGLRSLPVIVTSYEIAMRDRIPLSSFGYEWKYMIVDEGHRIKNLNCKLIRELKLYRVGNRLLLTGTPLQNNLAELWSLLNFLLPDIFDDLNSFQSWFDFSAMENNEQLIAQEQEAKVLQTLHSILTPFLLRRLKTDVDLSIPPKKEVLVYAPLTQKQQEFYKATLDRTIMNILEKNQRNEEEKIEYSGSGRAVRKTRKSVKYAEGDSQEFDFDALLKEAEDEEKRLKELKESKKKYDKKTVINIRMQNILMQLRKCVNHPYLIEFPFNTDTNELNIDENLVQSSGKLLLLDRMLPALLNQGHKVLIFSQMTQMLDIISDYCDIRSFKFSRIDGTMGIQERQDNIESFSNDADRNIFLLSTRAGGLGLNLMAADTCIIFDSDWNPQCDLQAQDRCHRIGQKKPVVVYRLVTANTVDERIIERAASKRKLEKMVIHKKNFKGRSFARAITPKELLDLLDSKDVSSVVGKQQEVITDEQLERLLDRSDLEDILEENNSKKNNSKKEISEDSSNTIFKVLDTNNDDDLVF